MSIIDDLCKELGVADVYHLPVTDEILAAAINYPDITYNDLDALVFSVYNQEGMGPASEWLPVLSDKMNEIHFRERE